MSNVHILHNLHMSFSLQSSVSFSSSNDTYMFTILVEVDVALVIYVYAHRFLPIKCVINNNSIL
jgi:hypothetical protein